MTTKRLIGLLLILSLGSCYHTAQDPEFDMAKVLPADSMVLLLSDLHTADGIVGVIKDDKQPIGHLSAEYFEFILQKHMIGKDVFEESMRYYAYHTEKLDAIYEKVIIDLSKKESLALPEKDKDKEAETETETVTETVVETEAEKLAEETIDPEDTTGKR